MKKALIAIIVLILVIIGSWFLFASKKEVSPEEEFETSETGESVELESSKVFEGLSTLKFKQDYGEGTYKQITTYILRNLDKPSPDIRIERYMPDTPAQSRTITIVLGEEGKGWIHLEGFMVNGEWETLEENADTSFEREIEELSHIEYVIAPAIQNGKVIKQEHQPGPTLRIYDIEVNPKLDSSLFEPIQ